MAQPRFSDEELKKGFEGSPTILSEDGREYRVHIAPSSSKMIVTLAPHEKEDP